MQVELSDKEIQVIGSYRYRHNYNRAEYYGVITALFIISCVIIWVFRDNELGSFLAVIPIIVLFGYVSIFARNANKAGHRLLKVLQKDRRF